MTQYLVTTFKDSIGHVHPHVTAAKPNQTYQVVEAESKEEALRKANRGLGTTIKHERFTEEEKETLFGKDYKKGQ
ncbi:DUF1381 domain-containing protein [Staphylococcus aureus]|uniref:DUF1381 domain-containing protein n=1 Tax=Staphylococcus aureus TaxID=1280 RepID=UPI0013F65628|nr:DUF1381 domain-containing protein [Staphylococcus aureus]NHC98369.1 DUF1381 domain-containing protein [Staphylococcus aureus]NHE14308.1 DUF1381 domain-containing protein [Staphylococcus aureus]